ncbi:MAG TPA: 3-oxoadipyl-CoA thiolase [Chloroflexi bacterium]|jgi:3-oxoadipyl-CoA thiolase|nr:3-oxoadipyl-CoA thiolase [Chloroflexota bacterium]HAL26246.1 3-oxoadipyl-CoA thiolase [Chloroflexota bacterium]
MIDEGSRGPRDAFICAYVRTPFGRYAGALARLRPDAMAAHVLRAVVQRSGFDPAGIDDVILGNANQAGEDNRNVARMATLLAGFPVEVPAQTINRLCGSSLQAVNSAAEAIWSGQGELFIVGGVESMTRSPVVTLKPDTAFPRGAPESADSTIGWRFPHPQLVADGHTVTLGKTAENVAQRRTVSRVDQDCLALLSQQKTARAMAGGYLAEEIVATPVPQPKGADAVVTLDEHPRPATTLEALAALKPAFAENGSVTAGNSSGINDGASALVVASRERARSLGLKPIARIVSTGVAGVRPDEMGLGPIPSSRLALKRAGLGIADLDVIELNEAFASQVIASCIELGIDWRDERKLNPNGGAIAIGHPLGASGARLAGAAALQLRRTNGRYALVTMCIGVGQGIATVLERASD